MLTAERVNELLKYDPATGELIWKVNRGGAKAGSVVRYHKTTSDGKTYLRIKVDGKIYYAHRLSWLLVHGEFPKQQIDHINGNGLDNRLSNLREVTNAENGRNVRKRSDNTSGVAGVYWHRSLEKWAAKITINGKQKHLGLFENFDAAVAARKAAETKYEFHANHGSERPL